MIRTLIVALAVAAAGAGPALAAGEVKISADTFVVSETTSEATFSGNVVITREGLEVRADKVVVTYGPGGTDDLRSFEATGTVRIKTEGQTAVGSRAVFDPSTQVLTVSGDVEVTSASGRVTGPLLTVDLKTNTTTFKGGGNGRVTGVFTPQ